MLLFSENVYKVEPFYRWNLIENDPDDNKFVDCAIAGEADYIITNDNHFNILSKIEFPKVEKLTIEEFNYILKK